MIFVIALSKEVLGIYPLIKGKNLALMLQQLLEGESKGCVVKGSVRGIWHCSYTLNEITGALSEFGKVVGLYLYNQASFWAANIMNFVCQFFHDGYCYLLSLD